ncbi:MAG: hypothetical protein QXP84_05135 [Candidatus Korarchaeum sp.]
MRKVTLTLIMVLALLIATLPLWYSPPSAGRGLRISGKLKDVGGRTIVIAAESGDVAVELRGEYAGGLKWHQVIDKLRAYLGEEIRVEAEYRGNSLVALAIELPSKGVKF